MKTLAAFAVLWTVMTGRSATAQDTSGTIPAGLAYGVTLDRFGVDQEYRYTAATIHISGLKPNNLSSEFAFSVFPQFLLARQLVANLDVGAAINIALPRSALLVRGGASGLFALGGGAAAVPGYHLGASLLIKLDGRGAFRFDVIRRVFHGFDRTSTPSMTIGVGFTVLPAIH